MVTKQEVIATCMHLLNMLSELEDDDEDFVNDVVAAVTFNDTKYIQKYNHYIEAF